MAKYEVKDGVGIIPEWATEIKVGAFEYCEELKSVVIPQWVKKIGKDAFYGCKNLESVVLPEWLEEIGDWTFSGLHYHFLCNTTVGESILLIQTILIILNIIS